MTGVLQNAIFSNHKDYIQLYKDLKNGNYDIGAEAGSLRHEQDKKSDNMKNSRNYDEPVTYALENAILLDPYTDYEKLYKDQKDSLANSPTTRNPISRDNNFQQHFSTFEYKVSIY